MPARLFLSSGDLIADRRFEFARDMQLKGDLPAAADLLTQAIELAPNFASAWFTLGEIRAKLGGMELTDNVNWRDLYQRNGTVLSDSMGRKRTGKWWVEQDQLCIEFEKEPVPECYDVWLSGKTVELRREGSLPLQSTLEPSSGRN